MYTHPPGECWECVKVCAPARKVIFSLFSFLPLFFRFSIRKKIPHLQLPPSSTTGIASGVFLLLLLLLLLLFSPFRWRRWVGTKRWEEVGSRRRVVGFKSCSKQSSRLSIVVRASVGRRIVAESNVCVCVSSVSRAFVSPSTSNWDLVVFFFLLCTLAVETRQKKKINIHLFIVGGWRVSIVMIYRVDSWWYFREWFQLQEIIIRKSQTIIKQETTLTLILPLKNFLIQLMNDNFGIRICTGKVL